MKTSSYNPSPIEREFAQAFKDLQAEIQKRVSSKIIEVEKNLNTDNPTLLFKVQDLDGDIHELVVKFIQRLED